MRRGTEVVGVQVLMRVKNERAKYWGCLSFVESGREKTEQYYSSQLNWIGVECSNPTAFCLGSGLFFFNFSCYTQISPSFFLFFSFFNFIYLFIQWLFYSPKENASIFISWFPIRDYDLLPVWISHSAFTLSVLPFFVFFFNWLAPLALFMRYEQCIKTNK